MNFSLIATSAFGLEAVVSRELQSLGYEPAVVRPGRLRFVGDAAAIARCNLWLRSADRVLVELADFPAADFDAIYAAVQAIAWEEWLPRDAAMLVRGRSHKSQLSSVPALQRTVKKGLVQRMLAGGAAELPETGPPLGIEASLVDDRATIDLDTSGRGLHRRGYRTLAAKAQLRETLAAGMLQLSGWRPERPLVDPFCGSGTIVIEAALIARRLAPGRLREFAGENLLPLPSSIWRQAREEAADLALPAAPERPIGQDADATALKLARHHASQAGVSDDCHFQHRTFAELSSSRKFGVIVANPPYGVRLGDDREVAALYRTIPLVLRRLPTWSHFLLSSRTDFEQLVGQQADRRRKLYNGRLPCTLYQYFGPRPGRRRAADSGAPVEAAREPEVGAEPDGVAEESVVPPESQPAVTVDAAVPRTARRDAPPPRQAFGGLRQEAQRQATELANRLRKQARHLRRWPTKRGVTCYRLYDRDIPEVPLAIDRYEQALHIAQYDRPHDRTPAEHADWLDLMVRTAAEVLEVSRDLTFVKQRRRQRGESQYERFADAGVTRVAHEGGLQFQINLSDYLDVGLFLDHRLTRGMVRQEAAGKRVLNLFAYTATFSVYAAAGGAISTTSVDLSTTYLDWAATNFRLNGLAVGEAHRLIREDCLKFLTHGPREELYDLAIVDPPTFSNSKSLRHDWDIQRDHGPLLQGVVNRLTPGGVLYFSTNSRRFKLDDAALAGTTAREISHRTVPEDFRNKRIHRCWRAVKSAI